MVQQHRMQEGVIIEFRPNGRFVKVTAVCEKSGQEVSMVGDANHSRDHLAILAARKLRFVQSKNS